MAYRRGGRARGGAVPVTAPTARAALSADGAWWRELDDEDPITLEPLRELPYPPFQLDSEGVTHFFDGAVLAQYMMSQGRFENPYTREALSLPECERLDAHLRQHDLPAARYSVAEARALQLSVKVEGGADVSRRQREAAVALQGLFTFRRQGAGRSAAPRRVEAP